MRSALPLMLVAAVVLSGCSGEEPPGPGGEPDTSTPLGNVTVPKDMVFTGSLVGAAPPVAPPVDTSCALGAQQCADHVVTVPAGTWNVTFTLVGHDGTVAGPTVGSDYDLYVDGVGSSVNVPPEPDVVKGKLKAGDYTAQVVAYSDVDGSYTLTVTFAM